MLPIPLCRDAAAERTGEGRLADDMVATSTQPRTKVQAMGRKNYSDSPFFLNMLDPRDASADVLCL